MNRFQSRRYRYPRKSYKRTSAKRYVKRMFNRKMANNVSVVRAPSGRADKTVVKLVYNSSIDWNGAAFSYHQWRLNSLYDPDYSGAGGQPLYYDYWAAFYGRYRVKGCHIKLQLTNRSTTSVAIVGMYPQNGSTASTPALAQAQPRLKEVMLPLLGGPTTTIEQYYDNANLWGQSKLQYMGDDTTGALVSTNPTEVINLITYAKDVGAAANVAVSGYITMTFYCEFYDAPAVADV